MKKFTNKFLFWVRKIIPLFFFLCAYSCFKAVKTAVWMLFYAEHPVYHNFVMDALYILSALTLIPYVIAGIAYFWNSPTKWIVKLTKITVGSWVVASLISMFLIGFLMLFILGGESVTSFLTLGFLALKVFILNYVFLILIRKNFRIEKKEIISKKENIEKKKLKFSQKVVRTLFYLTAVFYNLVFIASVGGKVFALKEFARVMRTLFKGLPDAVYVIGAIFFIFVELFIIAGLWSKKVRILTCKILMACTFVFILVHIRIMMFFPKLDCKCFGALYNRDNNTRVLLENIGLFIGAIFIFLLAKAIAKQNKGN